MSDDRKRAGRFFLEQRGKRGIWQICWYNAATRQTASKSTGTADSDDAEKALARHFLEHNTPDPRADAPLNEVLQTYFVKYAQNLPSVHVQKAAMRDAVAVWDDPNVNDLDRDKQLELVKALRERGLSDWTIQGRLNRIWAAINWCHRGKIITQVPAQIIAADWKPYLPDNEQTYTIEELAALFNASTREIERETAPVKSDSTHGALTRAVRLLLSEMPEEFTKEDLSARLKELNFTLDSRTLGNAITFQVTQGNIVRGPSRGLPYRVSAAGRAAAIAPVTRRAFFSREHWRRFLVLAVATCGRVTALLELKWEQIDMRLGRIYLNPEGRRQNNKRRATVPITRTLARELETWERDSEHVITYYGRPLATSEFYDSLAETAGVTGGPNVIRHTVRTFLAEVGVPDPEGDAFMGHKGEGSATGARYTHRRPEYLKSVKEGLELLFEALSEFVERPFVGWELVDQPGPEELERVMCVSTDWTCLHKYLILERETRLELATPTLARPSYPSDNKDFSSKQGTEGTPKNKDLPL